ncbi:MAG: modification methylase [Ectothiorhodospiraceae bacterium AqS1]|nr:modification methylase [Ectothiorhodospiraceae bacterium AqS1]
MKHITTPPPPPKTANRNLNSARLSKQDEFYTRLSDIEQEMQHYREYFKGRVVYCNCDDPRASNFFHFFSHQFERFGLKKLIASCYQNLSPDIFSLHESPRAVYLEYEGDKDNNRVPNADEIEVKEFKDDGDFRNDESIELLKKSDIVVTNPPFSLFREYVAQLLKYKKKFIIIGNFNAVTYRETQKNIKENEIWLGVSRRGMTFDTPYGEKSVNACWYTNLPHQKRNQEIVLHRRFSRKEYPEFDNIKAIHVERVSEIPCDYDEVMGVPITFLEKYNPNQFEILGLCLDVFRGNLPQCENPHWKGSMTVPLVSGKKTYRRLLIKKRNSKS